MSFFDYRIILFEGEDVLLRELLWGRGVDERGFSKKFLKRYICDVEVFIVFCI